MDETVKLTEKRRAALEMAATADGLDWYWGDRAHSAICNWLFKQKLVVWDYANRKEVLVATPAGRAALSPTETPNA